MNSVRSKNSGFGRFGKSLRMTASFSVLLQAMSFGALGTLATTNMAGAQVLDCSSAAVGGVVVCSNDLVGGFDDQAGNPITSFTVNDTVQILNNDIAISINDNDATTIDTFTIGTGANVETTGSSIAINLENAVTNFTNNGTVQGSVIGIAAVNSTTTGASVFNNNGTIKASNINAAIGLLLNFPNAPSVTVNNNLGAMIDASSGKTHGINSADGTNLVLENSGTILGGSYGVVTNAGNDSITNNFTGVIAVGNQAQTGASHNAIDTGADDDTVINSGILRSLNGGQANLVDRETVDLGGGDDTFEKQAFGLIVAIDGANIRRGTVNGGDDTDLLRFGGTGDGAFNLDAIGNTTDADIERFVNFENFSVVDGNWSFTGTTTQDFSVDGGTMMGTGTFGAVTSNNGGTLSPGNSIGEINTGDLNLGAGSILLIEVSQTGADMVNVTGAVTINNGAVLQVEDLAPALQDASQTFVIINNDGADAVTGNFGTVTDNLAFLVPVVTTTGGDGNDVELSFTVDTALTPNTPVTTPANPNTVFGAFATNTGNQGNVGQALTKLDTTPGSEGEALTNKLLVLTNDQALQTYTDLSGDIHSSAVQNFFDVSNQLGDALSGRFGNIQPFGAAGTQGFNSSLSAYQAAFQPTGVKTTQAADAITNGFSEEQNTGSFWGSVTGHYSTLNSDGNATGTQSKGFGFVTGFDRRLTMETTLGFAAGYAGSDVDNQNGNSELDVESYSFSAYGVYTAGNLNLNGFAAYTRHELEGTRRISALGLTAGSDYSADQFTVQGEASYRIEQAHEDIDMLPFVIGRYTSVETDGFTETGAGGANLTVSDSSHNAFDLTTGLRFERVTDTSKMYLSGGYQHRFGDIAPDNTYTFAGGGTFTAAGVERSRGSGFVEAGLETEVKENVVFFANGAANLGSDFEAYSGNAGFKVAF